MELGRRGCRGRHGKQKAAKPLRRAGWVAQAGAGERSRGLGHRGDKEALTPVERALHNRGAWVHLGGRGPWDAGRPSESARDPVREGGRERSCPAPGALLRCARGPEGGRGEGPGLHPCYRGRLPEPPDTRNSPSRSCLRPEIPVAPSPHPTWPHSWRMGPLILGDWEAPFFPPTRLFSRECLGRTRRERTTHVQRPCSWGKILEECELS